MAAFTTKVFFEKTVLQQCCKVAKRATLFQRQLGTCEKDLQSGSWFFGKLSFLRQQGQKS